MEDKERSKSWFCVWNNPQLVYENLEPHVMAEQALTTWVENHPTRSGAIAYCISEAGLIHFHMVLEDSNKSSFGTIKKLFPKAHIEPTKGTKEQAEAYIHKKGKWEEKGEQVIYIAQHGEIKGNQGSRRDLDIIEEYIEQGMTPRQIMALQLGFRRYEKMIKEHYYEKRNRETPFLRDINVIWHVGESGSGKSYTAKILSETVGEDGFYFVTDYDGGGLDRYNGEPILFLDEFRGQIKYSTLLSMLHGYKVQVHCRYTNCISLWNEVHITSVLPPERVYSNMVYENKDLDTLQQLKRRITTIIYHWKDKKGQYKQFALPFENYVDYETLKNCALGTDGFIPLAEGVDSPFQEQLSISNYITDSADSQ